MAAKKEVFSVELRTGNGLYQTTSPVQALIVATLNDLPQMFARKRDLAELIAAKYQKPGTNVSPDNALQNVITGTRKAFNPGREPKIVTGYPISMNDVIVLGYGLIATEDILQLGLRRVETGKAKNDGAYLVKPERFAPRDKVEELVLRLEGRYTPKSSNPLESLVIPQNKTEWLSSIEQIEDPELADRLRIFATVYLEPPDNQNNFDGNDQILTRQWPIKGANIVTAVKIAMKPTIIDRTIIKSIVNSGIIKILDEEVREEIQFGIKELLTFVAFYDTYKKMSAFWEIKGSMRFDSWFLANKEALKAATTKRLGKNHLLSLVLNRKSLEEDNSFD